MATTVGLCQRSLSVFNPSNRLWRPIMVTSSTAINQGCPTSFHNHTLHLITQNLDGLSPRPIARANLLLNTLLNWTPNSSSNTLKQDVPEPPGTLHRDTDAVYILFLQEVTTGVRKSILDNPRVRDAFFVTDAEDESSFDGVPFANMTLLLRRRFSPADAADHDLNGLCPGGGHGPAPVKLIIGPTHRVDLPSKYGRRALFTDMHTPPPPPQDPKTLKSTAASNSTSKTYRLINAHLDSLSSTFPNRTKQLSILADLLRSSLGSGGGGGIPTPQEEAQESTLTNSGTDSLAPRSGGLIAGDFNAISPADHALLAQNGLLDAWETLHLKDCRSVSMDTSPSLEPEPELGSTWGLDRNASTKSGHQPGRLDKIALLGPTVQAKEMRVVRPGMIEVPRPGGTTEYIPCSDHCALSFKFTIQG